MGKATGFMDYDRQDKMAEDPKERIKHFKEFHTPLSKEEQELQGARCMACGVPFCQSGQMLMGMASGCLFTTWYRNGMTDLSGKLGRSILQTEKDEQLSGITSRVCPALCEAACTCGLNGDAVSSKANEYTLLKNAYKKRLCSSKKPVKVRTGKKVAVVGSGPSGLATADMLNRRGHSVTVFEREDKIGGLLDMVSRI